MLSASLESHMLIWAPDGYPPPPQVKLPRNLQEQLEQTTAFKSRIAEVAKKHENTVRVLTDEAAQAAFAFCNPASMNR